MGRTPKLGEYVLRVNLKSGNDTRRYCEVRAIGDNVYVFQPRKSDRVKISYHASGQRHLKIGEGPALFVRHNERPEWIRKDEEVSAQSFENFEKLLPYKGEPAHDVFTIDLPPSSDTLPFAQISIGRFFPPKEWEYENVSMTTVAQQAFPILHSPSNL